MRTYGELSIDLHGMSPEKFGDLAEASATGGWARDRSKDEEMKRTGGSGAWFTFTLSGHTTLPSAFLFVTQKNSPDALYVPNIISPARDRLNYDEYNQILKSFAESVLAPLKAQEPHRVRLERDGHRSGCGVAKGRLRSFAPFFGGGEQKDWEFTSA